MTDLKRAVAELKKGGTLTLSAVPEGLDAFCVAELTQALARDAEKRSVVFVHVARDEGRARAFTEALTFADPRIEVLDFPAWDCQPYDRVSPNAGVSARRMTALSRLSGSRSAEDRPRILSTTINAVLQRVPPLRKVATDTFSAAPGNVVDMDALVHWLEINGFQRNGTVQDTGEYAVRGGILDLYPPALAQPVRLDFFGDTLETIRAFDPETQRTTGQLRGLDLVPMSEVQLTTETMRHFRQAYLAAFGAQTRGDTLYEAISEGRRHPGYEHWLPLFYDELDTIFDYTGNAPLILDAQIREAAGERLEQIADYYDARKTAHDKAPAHSPYKPVDPAALYLTAEEWKRLLATRSHAQVTSHAQPEGAVARWSIAAAASGGPSRPSVRTSPATCSRPRLSTCAPCRAPASTSCSWAGPTARASASPACSPSTASSMPSPCRRWPRRARWGEAGRLSPCSGWSRGSRRTSSPWSASRTFSATGSCASARSAKRAARTSSRRSAR